MNFKTIEDLENIPHARIRYVGFIEKDDGGSDGKPWPCDQWHISLPRHDKLANHTFEYFTGIGHREAPKFTGVLHSLVLDASAADENFNDWCANFGYDNDSIKALNTYQECLAVAEKLSQCFTREELEQIRELVQDY